MSLRIKSRQAISLLLHRMYFSLSIRIISWVEPKSQSLIDNFKLQLEWTSSKLIFKFIFYYLLLYFYLRISIWSTMFSFCHRDCKRFSWKKKCPLYLKKFNVALQSNWKSALYASFVMFSKVHYLCIITSYYLRKFTIIHLKNF